jgi:hypothetical protein
MVSANNATDPEMTTITSCAIEVAPRATRLIFTARFPAVDTEAPVSTGAFSNVMFYTTGKSNGHDGLPVRRARAVAA